MPARPVQVYDFTAFSRRTPTQQPPGDRLDAQFANHAQAIRDIIAGLETISKPQEPLDVEEVIQRVLEALEPRIEAVLNAYRDVQAIAQAVERLAHEAALSEINAGDQARHAETVAAAVASALAAPADPLPSFPELGPNAGGPYAADVQGATATAADYSQVSIEWAEHMPDTIPGNILAISAISGQHWSSRWWAWRAASMFGGAIVWAYLGAYNTVNAPLTTPTGDPLQPGMLYYDLDKGQMMVWTGHSWVSMSTPVPGVTASLYYLTTAGQTLFTLTIPDMLGNHAQPLQPGQGVNITLNGVRLTPDDGSGLKGDYTVNDAASTVTLLSGAPAGLVLSADVLILSSQIAPGAALVKKLKPITPDGSTTAFTIVALDGSAVNATNDAQVWISLDGVPQEPSTAYSVSGNTLTFVTAPAADSYVFGLWFSPP